MRWFRLLVPAFAALIGLSRAEDEVVGAAAWLEATVWPDHVNLARRVNLRGGKAKAVAQASGYQVRRDVCDARRRAPARAAVGRAKGVDVAAPRCKPTHRDDYRSVRLDQRLAADTVQVLGGLERRAPGETAVSGRAHLLQVAERGVVELGVAVAVVRAGRRVVTDGPVLVVELPVGRDDYGRLRSPRQPAVGGEADEDVNWNQRPRNPEVGDHPDVVSCGRREEASVAAACGRQKWPCASRPAPVVDPLMLHLGI